MAGILNAAAFYLDLLMPYFSLLRFGFILGWLVCALLTFRGLKKSPPQQPNPEEP